MDVATSLIVLVNQAQPVNFKLDFSLIPKLSVDVFDLLLPKPEEKGEK